MTEDILMGDLEKLEAKIDRLFEMTVSHPCEHFATNPWLFHNN